MLGEAVAIVKACDVFIAVGTSLQVQPAAGLAGIAADHGARLIIVNAETKPYDDRADEVVREPIGTALPGSSGLSRAGAANAGPAVSVAAGKPSPRSRSVRDFDRVLRIPVRHPMAGQALVIATRRARPENLSPPDRCPNRGAWGSRIADDRTTPATLHISAPPGARVGAASCNVDRCLLQRFKARGRQ